MPADGTEPPRDSKISLDGAVEQLHLVVGTQRPRAEPVHSDRGQSDRAFVRMARVPATRNGSSHVAANLRGRLWRAVAWTPEVDGSLAEAGRRLNYASGAERAVAIVSDRPVPAGAIARALGKRERVGVPFGATDVDKTLLAHSAAVATGGRWRSVAPLTEGASEATERLRTVHGLIDDPGV